MISYLKGKIILKKEGLLVLDVGGVGYQVFLSAKSFKAMPEKGSELEVFCYLDVGERSLKLYGFKTYEELGLFSLVRAISGVGPKAALEISSFGALDKIKKEITEGDVKFLDNIPGIGRKKAQKIILELSGKLKTLEPAGQKPKNNFENDEAFLALINLGFPKDQIKQTLSQLPQEMDTQEKIKQALRLLGR